MASPCHVFAYSFFCLSAETFNVPEGMHFALYTRVVLAAAWPSLSHRLAALRVRMLALVAILQCSTPASSELHTVLTASDISLSNELVQMLMSFCHPAAQRLPDPRDEQVLQSILERILDVLVCARKLRVVTLASIDIHEQ